MSGTKRIIDFPTSGAYDGYLLQDKSGGITSKVTRGTVAAGLKAEGLAWSPDLADVADPAKGAGLIGYSDAVVYTSLLGLAVRELRVGANAALRVSGGAITGNLTVNGWIESDQGYRDAGGIQRISSVGVGALTTLSTTGLATLASATVSDLPTSRIVRTTTGGRLSSDAGLTVTQSGGDTDAVTIGSTATGIARLRLNGTSAIARLIEIQEAGSPRWYFGGSSAGGTTPFRLLAVADDGTTTDDVLTIGRAVGSVITIGGTGAIKRPTDFTEAIRRNGTQVVNTRKTGWATATGTPTRTTFDTATVTLPQLAERFKALIDDLHATAGHGLIGT